MKTLSSSPTLPRLIDTAPLHRALKRLCLLTFLILPNSRKVLRNAHKIARATKAVIKAEQHNARVMLKCEMLLSPLWRARVLKDLGGARALKRWEKSASRAALRRAGIKILKPHASPAQRAARAINLAKAKAALFEKRRQQLRRFYDDSHERIFRDPCKVDFEGQFRLAPIARGPRIIKTKVKIEPRRLSSGIWDKPATARVRSIKINKINPIPIWPQDFENVREFEAAECEIASGVEKGKSSAKPQSPNLPLRLTAFKIAAVMTSKRVMRLVLSPLN